MKNKTWQKIGEVLLDYSKILVAIGILSPLMNNIEVNNVAEYGIILLVIILIITGFTAYNRGVENE